MNPTAHLTCQHTDGDLAVATVTGELTHGTAPAIRDQAIALIRQGHHHLILDMHQVTFCDSSGFSALVGIWRYAQQEEGTVVLAAVPDRLSRMLRFTGLEDLFLTYPTADEALAARSPS
ncbi:STAS domain-containing protein [Streptomyces sp. NPDC058664]|uniref:STAS domain-containing protein n=1 Tax=unclassified Streptomyces TaxID=2593676 RepID=UPI00365841E6